MYKILFGTGLAALLWAVPLWGAEPAPNPQDDPFETADVLDRHDLLDAVLDRNTSIEAARQAFRASTERIPQVTSLDDPMVGYSFGPATPFDDVRFGQRIDLRQKFPYPGKLRLAGDVARAEAEAVEQQIETVILDLAVAASQLYDDLYLTDRRLEINREHVRLLEGLLRTATARYAAGKLSQHEPLNAEVELAHLAHRDVILQSRREVVVARINALLHRPPGSPLPRPPAALPVPTDHVLRDLGLDSLQAAQEVALESRPQLAAIRAQVEARQAAVRLADMARYPDFDVGTSYSSMWAEPSHRWMVGATINVPIRKKRIRAEKAEAEARLAQVENLLLHLEDEVRAEVAQIHEMALEAQHVIELYDDRILPAGRDHVDAARASFEAGRAPLADVLRAEKDWRNSELAFQEVLADYHRRFAELARALGRLPRTGERRTR